MSKTQNILQKIITLIREGTRLPLVFVWQFPKSRLHHWPKLPQTSVNSKINHPTLQVQMKVRIISTMTASWLWGSFCSSKDNNTLDSPLQVPQVTRHDALYHSFLKNNCFVFLPYFIPSVCCFPVKQKLLLQKYVILWVCCDRGLDVQSSKYLAISQYLAFQLRHNGHNSTDSVYFTT